MVRLHVFNLAICRATRAATGLQLQNCPSQLLMNQKRFVDSGPYQWMVELRMLMCKLKALILNATISSHWWGKWYKGQLRMKLKLNSVVKEVLFNAYWLYRRNHCLQTLFLLFECLTRETLKRIFCFKNLCASGRNININGWCQPEYRYGQYTLCHRLCKSVRTVRIL